MLLESDFRKIARDLLLALAFGAVLDFDYFLLTRYRKRWNKGRVPRPFRFQKLSSRDCLKFFRFSKDDILRIMDLLHFPPRFKLWNRMSVLSEDIFCLVLRRLSYPCRLIDLQHMFPRHRTVLSNMFNVGIDFVHARMKSHLTTLNQPFLSAERLEIYANNVAETTDDLTEPMKIWAFIDGTTRRICRPSKDHRIVYNGKDRYHALKFEAVTALDGIIIHLAGPIEGARHDSHMLCESGLLDQLAGKMEVIRDMYRLYGDPAYSLNNHLITPHRNAKDREHIFFNEILAQVRVAV